MGAIIIFKEPLEEMDNKVKLWETAISDGERLTLPDAAQFLSEGKNVVFKNAAQEVLKFDKRRVDQVIDTDFGREIWPLEILDIYK